MPDRLSQSGNEFRASIPDADGLDKLDVLVGGLDSATGGRFVPQVYMTRFGKLGGDDECWYAVNHRGTTVAGESPKIDGDKVSLTAGGMTHRYYPTIEGLEYELVLQSRPATGYVELEIVHAEGLQFHHQPELTAEEIAEGAERPERVVNSYAVYWPKQGVSRGRDGALLKAYRCGKVGHIYRSFVMQGDTKLWIEQTIEPVGKGKARWRLYIPEGLEYPLTVGPTFGNTHTGDSVFSIYKDRQYSTGPCSPAADGVCDSVQIYIEARGAEYSTTAGFGLADGTLLGDSAGVAGAASQTPELHTLDSPVNVYAASSYLLAWNHNATTNYRYDDVATSAGYDARAYAIGTLYNPVRTSLNEARLFTAWCNYTAGGPSNFSTAYYLRHCGGMGG